MPPKKATAAPKAANGSAKKTTRKTATAADEIRESREVLKKKKKAPSTPKSKRSGTTGMRDKMIASGVPAKCAVSGITDLGFLEAAHIFPDCYIPSSTAKKNQGQLHLLDGFLPKMSKAERVTLLNGISNRILLASHVHKCFDGKSAEGAKLGCWCLAPTAIKGTYEIIVKPDHKKDMAELGVKDGAKVKLPHVHPKLIKWHFASFTQRLPTAGADGVDSDFDYDDGWADPQEVAGAAEVMRSFLDDQATSVRGDGSSQLLVCH